MARVVAQKENGVWSILIDADEYGGDKMTPAQARRFANDVNLAAEDASNNNKRDGNPQR